MGWTSGDDERGCLQQGNPSPKGGKGLQVAPRRPVHHDHSKAEIVQERAELIRLVKVCLEIWGIGGGGSARRRAKVQVQEAR